MPVRICFDTSVWLAIFNGEEEHDLPSISEWLARCDRGQATLLIPAVVSAEAATGKSPEGVAIYEAATKRPYVNLIDITHTIAMDAGHLRRRVLDAGMSLKTPDAIITAAAERFHANRLISVDKHILRMNGNYGLRATIGRPADGLDRLDLFDA